MASLREAKLRYITYYLQLAQQNRTNLDSTGADLSNIFQAVNYCVEIEDWQLLANMVSAVNDYWLKVAQWSDYIKFNALLLTVDLKQVDERIKVVSQLAEIEEIRGNYKRASHLYKDLIQLYEQREESPPENTLEVLRHLSRLARIQNNNTEAEQYLMQGYSISRRYKIQKDEADFLFELALLHEKRGDFEHAHALCESSLLMARQIGYYSRELDIFILLASIFMALHQPMRARDLYDAALKQAERFGAIARAKEIRKEIARLSAVMKRNVFISYNHEDKDFASCLANDLKSSGLSVWWDQWEIKVGDSIIQKVSDGIDGSAHLVVVLSPYSVKSDWVKREVGSALMRQLSIEKDIITLPVLIADCEIPVLLREIKYADFRQDYHAGFNILLEVLHPS
jgi:tetratricopeptide (TPR) repeat protein